MFGLIVKYLFILVLWLSVFHWNCLCPKNDSPFFVWIMKLNQFFSIAIGVLNQMTIRNTMMETPIHEVLVTLAFWFRMLTRHANASNSLVSTLWNVQTKAEWKDWHSSKIQMVIGSKFSTQAPLIHKLFLLQMEFIKMKTKIITHENSTLFVYLLQM